MKTGDVVVLTKIEDTKFGGHHPNNVNIGHTKRGRLVIPPKVGDTCLVVDGTKYLRTSPVIEIISENKFRTINSIYEIFPG